MLGLGKLSSQGMRFASVAYECRRDEKHINADSRDGAKFARILLDSLLDTTGFFARRGGS